MTHPAVFEDRVCLAAAVMAIAFCGCCFDPFRSAEPTVGHTRTELVRGIGGVDSIAVDGTSVYYGQLAEVRRVSTSGGKSISLYKGSSGPAMVLHRGDVYWIDAHDVMKMSKSGGAPSRLARLSRPCTRLAVDDSGVYASTLPSISMDRDDDEPDGELVRIPPGGAPLRIAVELLRIGSLHLDDAYVYWFHPEGGIHRVPKGGGAVTTVIEGSRGVVGMTLDDSYLYFFVRAGGEGGAIPTLFRARHDGTSVSVLGTGEVAGTEIAVDAIGLCWAEPTAVGWSGSLKCLPHGASSPVLLARGAVQAIALDAAHVYAIEGTSRSIVRIER